MLIHDPRWLGCKTLALLLLKADGFWDAGIIREMLQAGHEPEVPSFAALAIAAAQECHRSRRSRMHAPNITAYLDMPWYAQSDILQPTSLRDLGITLYSILVPLCAVQGSTGEDGDDEAAERWMEKARDRKLEWDAEAIFSSIAANVKTEWCQVNSRDLPWCIHEIWGRYPIGHHTSGLCPVPA